jgi:sigma-B regulation protein RsbU (phosphoserine phosphatase)
MPTTLGPAFEERLEEVQFTMEEGDAFFIFTDGITEAANREGQQYGIDRLINLFAAEMARSARLEISSLRKAIISELDDFSGFVKPADDITFVVARSQSPESAAGMDLPPDSEEREIETKSVKNPGPEPTETN